MAKYADVIIDISLEKLDRSFQYRIPERLRRSVRPGVPVCVPFGNGDRVRRGWVISLSDEPAIDPGKIKEIISVPEGDLPIESQLIALAAWMRENFGGTMSQALKTVLPVKRRTADREMRLVHLIPGPEEAGEILAEMERKRQTARARLMQALIEQSPLPYETVTGKLSVSSQVIRAMEEKGFVRVERIRSWRNPLDRMKKQGERVSLNPGQRKIVDDILEHYSAGDHTPCLIHGVTGSGKTEVYIELIETAVRGGRQAIVLIPEIALTFQTVLRFYNHFGDRVSILNSRMSAGERYDQYERAKNGDLDVIIGPRSALFTPFPSPGFIIIDEEHESSYKSESVPCYHARETAIARAALCGATVVMGSATPSVESYAKALKGEYRLYEMKNRVSDRPLPRVYIEDMREELREGNRSVLSARLAALIEDRLDRGEQAMLFINRRGMAGFVSCRSCGHVIKCPHCDVSLSLHEGNRLVCHYCGHTEPMAETCPECGSPYIGTFKAGTQKMEQYVRKRFPAARVLRMDLDTTRQRDAYENILSAFANGEADILIGTQMIVKGHDFPNVTLVGVLAADLSLNISDFRAAERTFQLLTQAAGRAGRGKRPGEVVIQTYRPDNFAINAAADQDYEEFYAHEIGFRRLMRYPPVWEMLVVHLSSDSEKLVNEASDMLQCELEREIAEFTGCGKAERSGEELIYGDDEEGGFRVIGPADAIVSKVNDRYRKMLFIKGAEYARLAAIGEALDRFVRREPAFGDVSVTFDFNPMSGF